MDYHWKKFIEKAESEHLADIHTHNEFKTGIIKWVSNKNSSKINEYKSKKSFGKWFFSSWWIMHFLEKVWKMWGILEILKNYSRKKKALKIRTKKSLENVLIIEMKRTQILIHKPLYLGLSIVEMSKRVMFKFW